MKEGYLERKLEPLGKEEHIPDALKRPLVEVDYEHTNEVDVVLGEGSRKVRLGATWEPVEVDPSWLEGEKNEQDEELFEGCDPQSWKLLNSFTLELSEYPGRDLYFFDMDDLPDIIFNPKVKEGHGYGHAFVESNKKEPRVVVFGDIFIPSGMLAMFHELGHIAFNAKRTTLDPNHFENAVWASENFEELLSHPRIIHPRYSREIGEIIIEEERVAWAAAIRALRPLIGAGVISKEDVLAMAHQWALQSYSDDIRKIMGGPVKKLLGRILGE